MSDSFNPSLANLARTERVHRADYTGTKAQQHKQSIDLMIAKIREGYKDRRIRERVGEVLHAAGLDGRNPNVTSRHVVGALLDYLRGATVYVADPVKTEYIQGAAATLCLAPGLCMKAGDCDDMTVAIVCLILCAGIHCWIVVETFGHNPMTGIPHQGHVLVGCKDEQGVAFAADPSTMKPVGGFSEHATARQWIDPLRDVPAEIIGVGRAPVGHGLGAGPIPPTANGTQIPGQWVATTGNQVTAGLRYAVGASVLASATWTAADVTAYFSPPAAAAANLGAGGFVVTETTAGPKFQVEQVIPASANNSWIMIGRPYTSGVVPATSTLVDVIAVLQEQPPATSTPAQNTAALVAPVPASAGSISLGTALAWGLGAAVLGGVGYKLYKRGVFK